jgi:signal transduction histidine kinase
MLADLLDRAKDQLADELEHLSAGPTEPSVAGDRKFRLKTLLRELIETLRSGGVHDPTPQRPDFTPTRDQTVEVRDRELLQRTLIERIAQAQFEASPRETAILAQWAGQTECARLREQTHRLGALLDRVSESAALLGPDGRILYCNLPASQALHEVVRLPREEIVGKTFSRLGVAPEFLFGARLQEFVSLARGHESRELRFLGRAKESEFDAVYRPDGTVDAVSVVVRDVHARTQSEMRVALLTKLSDLGGMSDPDHLAEAMAWVPIPELADWCTINLVESGRIRRTFVANRDPSKAQLRKAIMRTHPAWEQHPLWQELLTGGYQLLTEVTDDLLHKMAATDERYWLLSQIGVRSLLIVPIVSHGQTIGILTLAYTAESGRRYDREAPALAEEVALHGAHAFENASLMKNLQASEARFRIALAAAHTVVFEQDRALRYVWSYSPVEPSDLVGSTDDQLFGPDEAPTLTRLKKQVLEQGVGVEEELDLTIASGETRQYRETIEPLRDKHGKIVGVIGAATDITEQQRMRNRLAEELSLRERMTGVLSHDLRNPLGLITLAADRLLRTDDVPQTARDQVMRIRRSAGRMQEMIDTLLDFTHLRFLGQLALSPVPADLAEISSGVIDELSGLRPEHSIELEVRGDVRGEWDPPRMAQTISNLLRNALTHGEPGGPVRVSVQGDEREVTLEVHNSGVPIPPELIPVIFQPFRRGVQADQSPSGFGLGLYIVQQIVIAHGGTVGVRSTAQDGTTFTIRLPRKRSH